MRAELVPYESQVELDKYTSGDSEGRYVLMPDPDGSDELCQVGLGVFGGIAMTYWPEQITERDQEELSLLVGNIKVVWTPEEWDWFKERMEQLLVAGRVNRGLVYGPQEKI